MIIHDIGVSDKVLLESEIKGNKKLISDFNVTLNKVDLISQRYIITT